MALLKAVKTSRPGSRPWAIGRAYQVRRVLAVGATLEGARAEIEAIRARVAQTSPSPFDDQRMLRVVSLHDQLVGGTGVALRVLLGAVVFVLLIACANAANLQL